MAFFRFRPLDLPPQAEKLRTEVREFLQQNFDGGPMRRVHSWGGFDPEFSRKVGARGWIGLTWPRQ